jgi:hypothetical protein
LWDRTYGAGFLNPPRCLALATRRGFFMRDRAVVFIDGNNWYHGLGTVGVRDRARLDYKKICAKLLGPREWIATRYYIGQVRRRPMRDSYVYLASRRCRAYRRSRRQEIEAA